MKWEILLIFVLLVGCTPKVVDVAKNTSNYSVAPPEIINEINDSNLKGFKYYGQSAFQLIDFNGNNVVYIDPYNIPDNQEKADIILITHPHEDHCSLPDVEKIIQPSTTIVTVKDCKDKLSGIENIFKIIVPMQKVVVNGVIIIATLAYNVKENRLVYHAKEKGWVGFFIKMNGFYYYHAGDTDFIPEMKELGKVNFAMIPIGGKYTMDVEEAINATFYIDAEYNIPMHYRELVDNYQKVEKRWMSGVEYGLPVVLNEVK